MPDVETTISAVTVFTDRARITRTGTTSLQAGEQTLTIAHLPLSLESDSVRAAGRGEGVRILGVEVTTEYVTEAPEADLDRLQKELQALQDEDAALADEEAAQQARLDFVTSLRDASTGALPRGIAYGKANIEAVTSLADYVTSQFAEAQAARRELAAKRRDLAKQIEIVQRKLQPSYSSIERRGINVYVQAAGATPFELEVTYSTTGASWSPLYDVRLIENNVSLGYLASISQQTGEDWPAVKLSLSTARPAVSATLPELDPWYLDVFVPRPVMARSFGAPAGGGRAAPAPAAMSMQAMAMDEAAPPPMPKAAVAEAEVESTGASVTFHVQQPVAVPSDGSPHKTQVTTLDLDAKLDYVTVPKVAEEAYLRATITNNSQTILLPGPANIFHEDEFVGTTALESVVPNEEFEVQLGVDDRVKVERQLSRRDTSKALIGNTRRTLYGYTVTLTNHLAWAAKVTVEDQFPVARNEQIKSRLLEANPAPTEQTDLNVLKWTLDVPPGQKQEVAFTFQVEHPRDLQVTGLWM